MWCLHRCEGGRCGHNLTLNWPFPAIATMRAKMVLAEVLRQAFGSDPLSPHCHEFFRLLADSWRWLRQDGVDAVRIVQ